MNLPIIKDVTPRHTFNIPSTGMEISMRPYLVKEEKVLMIAFESKNEKGIANALIDVIQACIAEPLDIKKLATFDLEYLFLKLRSISVGETASVSFKCVSCGTAHDMELRLDNLEVEMPEDKPPLLVIIPNVISVQLQYPAVAELLNHKQKESETDTAHDLILGCIEYVITPDEDGEDTKLNFKDYPKSKQAEFVGQFSKKQFSPVWEFVQNLPQMSTKIEFTCSNCGTDNTHTAKGMQSFFS